MRSRMLPSASDDPKSTSAKAEQDSSVASTVAFTTQLASGSLLRMAMLPFSDVHRLGLSHTDTVNSHVDPGSRPWGILKVGLFVSSFSINSAPVPQLTPH